MPCTANCGYSTISYHIITVLMSSVNMANMPPSQVVFPQFSAEAVALFAAERSSLGQPGRLSVLRGHRDIF